MTTVLAFLYLLLFGAGAQTVVDAAESVAAGRPYCIQIAAAGGRYTSAFARGDLAASRMLSDREQGGYLGYHAILAIGDGPAAELHSWSHHAVAFKPLAGAANGRRDPAILCRPRVHFAATLPRQADRSSPSETDSIRVAGREFTIPSGYRARIVNELSSPMLSLDAKAPTFEPYEPTGPRFSRVSVYLSPSSVKLWLAPPSDYSIVEQTDGPAGLQKQTLVPPDRPHERWTAYFANDIDGSTETRISCFPNADINQIPCTYTYMHQGVLIYFQITAGDVVHWQAIQKRLGELMSSFEPRSASR